MLVQMNQYYRTSVKLTIQIFAIMAFFILTCSIACSNNFSVSAQVQNGGGDNSTKANNTRLSEIGSTSRNGSNMTGTINSLIINPLARDIIANSTLNSMNVTGGSKAYDSNATNGTSSSVGSITKKGDEAIRIINQSNIANSTVANDIQPQGYVLSGKWRFDEVNGTVTYFKANITMVATNGEDIHNHLVAFKAARTGVSLLDNTNETTVKHTASLSLRDNNIKFYGLADVITNGVIQWRDVPISVSIFNSKVISIKLDSRKIDNHFLDLPIYGMVNN
jgi:hypothetical protein